jgi:hypothetical protein
MVLVGLGASCRMKKVGFEAHIESRTLEKKSDYNS